MRILWLTPAFLLWPAQAWASSDCTVRLAPEDAPESWRAAAAEVRGRLQEGVTGDCRAVAVEVSGGRAFVVFTTHDGRQAVRRVESAEDLAPLVEALLVTLPLPPAATAEPASSAPTPSAAPTAVDRAPSFARETSVHVFVDASGGARVSTPGGFASPSFGARLGAVLGRWELAATGQWDPAHSLLGGGGPAGFTMSRYAVGVAAGRRMTVDDTTLAVGVTTAVAVVSEFGMDQGLDQTGGATDAEPLLGLYVGVAWPRRSAVRLRSELSADLVASRLGRTLSIDPSLPALPWWSAAASVGVEWEVP